MQNKYELHTAACKIERGRHVSCSHAGSHFKEWVLVKKVVFVLQIFCGSELMLYPLGVLMLIC